MWMWSSIYMYRQYTYRQYTSMLNCWFWYLNVFIQVNSTHYFEKSHSVNRNGVECSFGSVPSWTEIVGPLHPCIDLSLDIAVQEVSKLRQCLAINRCLRNMFWMYIGIIKIIIFNIIQWNSCCVLRWRCPSLPLGSRTSKSTMGRTSTNSTNSQVGHWK